MLVEPRAPGDQFTDAGRGLAHHRIHHIGVAKPAAGGQGVSDVIVEPILGIDDARDASLGPLAR